MPVEFLGIAGTNPASEVTPRTGGPLDLDYTSKLARAHEDNGWDRILFAYHSGSPDPAQVAAYVAGRTERINLVVAHRPNVAYPTLTAKTFATLDHISGGRFEVHVITGGSTADQTAEGDFLAKDDRYGRTREFIQILKQAWTSDGRFDFDEKLPVRAVPGRHQAAAATATADLVRWLVGCGVRGGCGRGGHLRALG
ncbi:LLM class flavin-dependent oxidoreductase [Kribbella sp. NPDC050124]|uniref:LLM class flavin-dependent oxidoreductase n=1 Tax=Kribbella sp. NPDC050124 TaxID=3364114 RepID=UPI00379D57DE